jgi:16S rRNA (guanine966-N2)-methyltransferase
MRIVGGTHRGRPIAAPADNTTRPTIDRVRESLFNMLLHAPALMTDAGKTRLDGGIVLDPFGGSGALSFEALSRGAHHAYLFEIDPAARRIILRNAETLDMARQITLRAADALHPGPAPAEEQHMADLVLMDPPYRSGIGPQALSALTRNGWLKPDALVVVETDARKGSAEGSFAIPPGFALLEERQQGPARLTFLLRER